MEEIKEILEKENKRQEIKEQLKQRPKKQLIWKIMK